MFFSQKVESLGFLDQTPLFFLSMCLLLFFLPAVVLVIVVVAVVAVVVLAAVFGVVLLMLFLLTHTSEFFELPFCNRHFQSVKENFQKKVDITPERSHKSFPQHILCCAPL